MKNKGFTLIELLAVVTILGIIAAISIYSISTSMENSRKKLYDTQIELIIDGAKTWAAKHFMELPENDGEEIYITLAELKEEGCVQSDIINPITNEPFNEQMQVRIKIIGENYIYEIVE